MVAIGASPGDAITIKGLLGGKAVLRRDIFPLIGVDNNSNVSFFEGKQSL
jgi:hypothetical protein